VLTIRCFRPDNLNLGGSPTNSGNASSIEDMKVWVNQEVAIHGTQMNGSLVAHKTLYRILEDRIPADLKKHKGELRQILKDRLDEIRSIRSNNHPSSVTTALTTPQSSISASTRQTTALRPGTSATLRSSATATPRPAFTEAPRQGTTTPLGPGITAGARASPSTVRYVPPSAKVAGMRISCPLRNPSANSRQLH
jgi:hypothetical protein